MLIVCIEKKQNNNYKKKRKRKITTTRKKIVWRIEMQKTDFFSYHLFVGDFPFIFWCCSKWNLIYHFALEREIQRGKETHIQMEKKSSMFILEIFLLFFFVLEDFSLSWMLKIFLPSIIPTNIGGGRIFLLLPSYSLRRVEKQT